MQVGQVIDQIDRAFGRVGVQAIVESRRKPSRDDRGTREAIVPGDRHSFRIETSRYPVEETGPVHVVLDIFLAGPYDLDGTVDLLRDLDGAGDTIGLQPPTEATADQMVVDHDLVQRQAGCLFGKGPGSRASPVADPEFAAGLGDTN